MMRAIMPWKNLLLMDQRSEFVHAALKKVDGITALCRQFQISRKTAHKWLKRYAKEGLDGMVNRSTKPKVCWNRTSRQWINRITKLRRTHPFWGGKKLRVLLLRKYGHEAGAPGSSTIDRILRQRKLSNNRTKRTSWCGVLVKSA